ncbi:MAG TPA: response regulator transcription factor [Burkholderiales bacterium]|nr:response regulator transcription factor [Burkholderiales bacterium]
MDVLLIDDHPIIHETLGAVVRSLVPDAQIHSEIDLGGAITKARQLKDLGLVLLDLGLPGFSGMEALLRFRKTFPRARVMIISATEDSDSVRSALDAGAVGYMPKTSTAKVMSDAIRLVLDGGFYVPPQAMGTVLPTKKPPSLADLGITERQADVLRLVAKGLPNIEIGRKLNISENTVKQHAHAAYRALGVSSRTEAMVVLAKMGIRDE